MEQNMTKSKHNITGLWKFFFWPVIWAAVFWSAYLLHERCTDFDSLGIWSVFTGAGILIWAFAIHIVAGKSLKKFGHTPGHKSIWPNQMVTTGIYSCMRHPQHLGLAMIPLGIALISGSASAVLSAGWAILAALFFVIVIEEPECMKKFSEEYFQYMQETPPFCLHPKCLAKGWKELKE